MGLKSFYNGFTIALVALAAWLQIAMLGSAAGDPDKLTAASSFYQADRFVIAFLGIAILTMGLARNWLALVALAFVTFAAHWYPATLTHLESSTAAWLIGSLGSAALAVLVFPGFRLSWLLPWSIKRDTLSSAAPIEARRRPAA